MPIKVEIGEEIIKVELWEGTGSVKIPEGVEPIIDPDKWITMGEK